MPTVATTCWSGRFIRMRAAPTVGLPTWSRVV
jgi:hypothetical protein